MDKQDKKDTSNFTEMDTEFVSYNSNESCEVQP